MPALALVAILYILFVLLFLWCCSTLWILSFYFLDRDIVVNLHSQEIFCNVVIKCARSSGRQTKKVHNSQNEFPLPFSTAPLAAPPWATSLLLCGAAWFSVVVAFCWQRISQCMPAFACVCASAVGGWFLLPYLARLLDNIEKAKVLCQKAAVFVLVAAKLSSTTLAALSSERSLVLSACCSGYLSLAAEVNKNSNRVVN